MFSIHSFVSFVSNTIVTMSIDCILNTKNNTTCILKEGPKQGTVESLKTSTSTTATATTVSLETIDTVVLCKTGRSASLGEGSGSAGGSAGESVIDSVVTLESQNEVNSFNKEEPEDNDTENTGKEEPVITKETIKAIVEGEVCTKVNLQVVGFHKPPNNTGECITFELHDEEFSIRSLAFTLDDSSRQPRLYDIICCEQIHQHAFTHKVLVSTYKIVKTNIKKPLGLIPKDFLTTMVKENVKKAFKIQTTCIKRICFNTPNTSIMGAGTQKYAASIIMQIYNLTNTIPGLRMALGNGTTIFVDLGVGNATYLSSLVKNFDCDGLGIENCLIRCRLLLTSIRDIIKDNAGIRNRVSILPIDIFDIHTLCMPDSYKFLVVFLGDEAFTAALFEHVVKLVSETATLPILVLTSKGNFHKGYKNIWTEHGKFIAVVIVVLQTI